MNKPLSSLTLSAPRTTLDDIYYGIFRHKWKIIACTAAGVLVALGIYFFQAPPAESEAELFIRYVRENSAPGLPGNDSKAISPDQRGETIVATEAAILRSRDIAYQAVDAIGLDKILSKAKGPKDRDRAASEVQRNLVVNPLPKSSVIQLIFQSQDPALVQPVLTAIIEAYLKKHVEVHRGIELGGDFLSQETDQLRSRLSQTEDELRRARDKAGITSLDDAKKAYTQEMAQIQQEIFSAQAEFADKSATFQEVEKQLPSASQGASTSSELPAPAPDAAMDDYRSVLARLDLLRRTEQQYLGQYTAENPRMRNLRAEIAATEVQKQGLEKKYPGLLRLTAALQGPGGSDKGAYDLATQSALLVGLQSRI